MDARDEDSSLNSFKRPRVVRLVAAWLAVVLAVGLWQGYGAWLTGGSDAG